MSEFESPKIVVKNGFSCNGVTKAKGEILLEAEMAKIGDKLFAGLVVGDCFVCVEKDKAEAQAWLNEQAEKEAEVLKQAVQGESAKSKFISAPEVVPVQEQIQPAVEEQQEIVPEQEQEEVVVEADEDESSGNKKKKKKNR